MYMFLKEPSSSGLQTIENNRKTQMPFACVFVVLCNENARLVSIATHCCVDGSSKVISGYFYKGAITSLGSLPLNPALRIPLCLCGFLELVTSLRHYIANPLKTQQNLEGLGRIRVSLQVLIYGGHGLRPSWLQFYPLPI